VYFIIPQTKKTTKNKIKGKKKKIGEEEKGGNRNHSVGDGPSAVVYGGIERTRVRFEVMVSGDCCWR
jgi:hypothetical protein